MKLNRKGYMLVEIILASVLAMSIAYYLLNLTYRFKNTNQDIYQSIEYNNVKNLITKNIMNELNDGYIAFVDYGQDASGNDYVAFLNNCIDTRLTIQKESNGTKKIVYGEYTSNGYNQESLSYYEKQIPDSLIVENMIVTETTNSLEIKIPIQSMYSDERYDINIFVSKNTKYLSGVNVKVDNKIYYNGYPKNSLENSVIKFAIKVNGEDKGYVENLCSWSKEEVEWQIYAVQINGVSQDITPINLNINNTHKIVYLNFISSSGSYTYQGYNSNEDLITS